MGDASGNIHDGHRKRKKEQFLKSGISHLPEHEMLEFLLYYAIPRGDTNEPAHALINRFGSLTRTFDAGFDELTEVKGVGENAASLICLARMLAEVYFERKTGEDLIELFNSDRLKNYCSSLFITSREEEIRCVYLTDDLKLISSEKICSGTVGKVEIPVRKITRSVFANNCSRIVIAHNHPAGTCIPSRADLESTKDLCALLGKIEIELIDHIIVGRDGVTSMKESGYF